MPCSLRLRLSVMMFLQYFVLGAWAVTLPTYLMAPPHEGGLNFPAHYVGLLYGTMAVGATMAPFLIGLLADRLFSTERVLAVLHAAGAAILVCITLQCVAFQEEADHDLRKKMMAERIGDDELWRLVWHHQYARDYLAGNVRLPGPTLWDRPPFSQIFRAVGYTPRRDPTLAPEQFSSPDAARARLAQLDPIVRPALARFLSHPDQEAITERAFPVLFALMMANALCYLPSVTLTNALSFRNLVHPERHFSGIRVLGTVGWAAAGLFVGWYMSAISAGPVALAAVTSALLAGYCLTLPHTPPAGRGKTLGDALGLPALKMLAEPSFRVFVVTSLFITMLMAFHNVYTNKCLDDLGVPKAAAWQTVGQLSEVVCILAIPFVRSRIGLKRMLLVGLVASAIRYGFYAIGNHWLLIFVGLPMHGVCYSFYFIAAAMYIDRQAPRDLRASAQGLVTLLTLGLGAFLGNWLAGVAVEWQTIDGKIAWAAVWSIPAAGSAIAAAFFALRFHEPAGQVELIPVPNSDILAGATVPQQPITA